MPFAARLQELRKKSTLSQSELAKKSGIPLPSLRGYERSHREPSWLAFLRLCQAMDVSPDEFMVCVPGAEPEPEKPERGRPRKGG